MWRQAPSPESWQQTLACMWRRPAAADPVERILHRICSVSLRAADAEVMLQQNDLRMKLICACAGGRVVASPYAHKLAADAGVDIGQASGSGPGGRIVAQDVQQLIDGGGGKAPSAEAGTPSTADGATDVNILSSPFR